MNLFGKLDPFLFSLLKIDPKKEMEYYETRESTKDTKIDLKKIHYAMSLIDSKSSALLTHISVMFVVLGFFLSNIQVSNHWIVDAVILAEFIAYLLIGMLLLRCLEIMGPPLRPLPKDKEKLMDIYYREISLRREIYQRSLRFMFLLTGILVPTIVIKYANYIFS